MNSVARDTAWSRYYLKHGTRPILRDRDRVLSNRERIAIWRQKIEFVPLEERVRPIRRKV